MVTVTGLQTNRLYAIGTKNEYNVDDAFFYTCNGAIWVDTSSNFVLVNSRIEGSYIDPAIIIIGANIKINNNCIFGCSSVKCSSNNLGDIVFLKSSTSIDQMQNAISSCASSYTNGNIYCSISTTSQIFQYTNFSYNYDAQVSGPIIESRTSLKLSNSYFGNNKCVLCLLEDFKLQGSASISKLIFEKNCNSLSTHGYYHCSGSLAITVSESVFISLSVQNDLSSSAGILTVKSCYFSQKPRFGSNVKAQSYEQNLRSTETEPIGLMKCPFHKSVSPYEDVQCTLPKPRISQLIYSFFFILI